VSFLNWALPIADLSFLKCLENVRADLRIALIPTPRYARVQKHVMVQAEEAIKCLPRLAFEGACKTLLALQAHELCCELPNLSQKDD
jgi:hypothetical protein